MTDTIETSANNPVPPDNETEDTATVCYCHPDRETGLRCNKCGRYICAKCATRTPVGYTCPECIRDREDKFYTGGNTDYALAVVVALPLSFITAILFSLVGGISFFGWIIAFFAAPFAAGLIAEAVRRVVQRRRSRYLWQTVLGCLVAATLPFFLFALVVPLFFGGGPNVFAIIPHVILIFAGGGTIRLRLG